MACYLRVILSLKPLICFQRFSWSTDQWAQTAGDCWKPTSLRCGCTTWVSQPNVFAPSNGGRGVTRASELFSCVPRYHPAQETPRERWRGVPLCHQAAIWCRCSKQQVGRRWYDDMCKCAAFPADVSFVSSLLRFIEHGEYKENQYGTSIEAIRSVQAKNKMCIVDVQPEVGVASQPCLKPSGRQRVTSCLLSDLRLSRPWRGCGQQSSSPTSYLSNLASLRADVAAAPPPRQEGESTAASPWVTDFKLRPTYMALLQRLSLFQVWPRRILYLYRIYVTTHLHLCSSWGLRWKDQSATAICLVSMRRGFPDWQASPDDFTMHLFETGSFLYLNKGLPV